MTEHEAGEAEYDARTVGAVLRTLFDENPDLVWAFDLDATVRRVNPRVEAVLGYRPDEVLGRPLADFVLEQDQPHAAATFASAAAGRPAECVCRLRHRDGHEVVMRANVMPLVVDGVVTGVFAGAQDVTAAHSDRQRLREGAELYRLVVEQSPECVAILQDERYAYVNEAGARMGGPGVTPDDVIGAGWVEFIHPDDRARVAAEYEAVLAGPANVPRPIEKRLVRPDGRALEVEGTVTRVAYRGRPAVHSFTRDVTARRRAEAELRRTQRLEALGRLAAGVAHDFNNLLAVMLTAVEVAAEAVPADDVELRGDLHEARKAALRARALTRQLLTFARRESTAPREVDVNTLVLGMGDLLRRLAGPRVRLELALAADAGTVLADPAQAEQALLNLVTNARDALDGQGEGGAIVVETARENGDLRLTVRDTGPGIPADVRPHLFEPFYTTKAEGHGLGLATVYGVVTGAGGRIDVESEPGRGTAFHVRLPRAEGQT